VSEETIDDTPRRRRQRLAKAELWMTLAGAAADLDEYSSQTIRIARTYGLADADVKRLCGQIAQELENRALRAGYEETWPVPDRWDPRSLTWDPRP
jgi:hypothetical protein